MSPVVSRPLPFRRTLMASVLGTVLGTGLSFSPLLVSSAVAQSSVQTVNIQARHLADALSQLAIEYGVQLSYNTALVAERSSPVLRGSYSLEESLDQLLVVVVCSGVTPRME